MTHRLNRRRSRERERESDRREQNRYSEPRGTCLLACFSEVTISRRDKVSSKTSVASGEFAYFREILQIPRKFVRVGYCNFISDDSASIRDNFEN